MCGDDFEACFCNAFLAQRNCKNSRIVFGEENFRLNLEFSDRSENPLLVRMFLTESTARKLQGLESRKLNSEEMCLSIF